MLNSKQFETAADALSGSGPRPPTGTLWSPMVEFFDEELDTKFMSQLPLESHNSSSQSNDLLELTLYHKVRGGKGEWREVQDNEMIRVTKGVGKKLKLVIKSPPLTRFSITEITLTLDESSDVSSRTSKIATKNQAQYFSVENSSVKQEATGTSAELFLKVFRLGKQLCFCATISPKQSNPPSSPSLFGKSINFGTHNSGKQRKKKDRSGSPYGAGDSGDSPPDSPAGGEEEEMSDDVPDVGREKRRRLEPTASDPTASDWSSTKSSSSVKSDPGGQDSPRTPKRSGTPEVLESMESFLKRSAPPMKSFVDIFVAPEARRRNAGVAVFLSLRRPAVDPQDFTIFVYRGINLVPSHAQHVGSKHGRLIFLPPDQSGDYSGSYTLIAGTRPSGRTSSSASFVGAGGQELVYPFSHPAGVAALFDFRVDPPAMRLIPAEPAEMGSYVPDSGGTLMWMIAPFRVSPSGLTWLSLPAPQTATPTSLTPPMTHLGIPPPHSTSPPVAPSLTSDLSSQTPLFTHTGAPLPLQPPPPYGLAPSAAPDWYPHMQSQQNRPTDVSFMMPLGSDPSAWPQHGNPLFMAGHYADVAPSDGPFAQPPPPHAHLHHSAPESSQGDPNVGQLDLRRLSSHHSQ